MKKSEFQRFRPQESVSEKDISVNSSGERGAFLAQKRLQHIFRISSSPSLSAEWEQKNRKITNEASNQDHQ
jgi:hypothetical protein